MSRFALTVNEPWSKLKFLSWHEFVHARVCESDRERERGRQREDVRVSE